MDVEQLFNDWVADIELDGRPYWKVTDHATAFEAGYRAALEQD